MAKEPRPIHVGIVAPPFPSHYRALQALAAELIERGHRVTFIDRADAARWLDDSRIGFHTLGHVSHPSGSLSRLLRLAASPGSPWGLLRLIRELAANTDMLCRELPEALGTLGIDLLLCDQMEAAGGLVAEAAGLPYVSVACALPVNREPGIPLPVMPMAFGQGSRYIKMYASSERVYDVLMSPLRRAIAVNAETFGLPPRDGLHECLSPYAQISQTVPGFELPRRALPAHFHHVGPLRPPAMNQGALALPAAEGRPLVFASLGTLQGHRYRLFRRIARACRHLDVQLLLAHCGGLSAHQALALEREGASWVTDFAPQRAALERADAVITHGGLNTVMDALSTRTPMLVLPIAFDQPGVAARIEHAGVGLRASPTFAGTRSLAGELHELLHDGRFTAPLERLGAQVDAAGGVPAAADIVENTFAGAVPAGRMDCA
ncbi:zeaxanthin glucosyltransferase [Modicisalibacter xianhensis]|uniref:Zeaxanthin glucosyltransferase n=1 Tax=Modicisalibacter xianhensis TaxID=442341 RepID=A0A4R8G4X7_9GAMM|nr:nucleotide disphospho-sugar-binding domain-containing protein [Halomonas xianhensis]TDX31689.1 zeaxanthin glucosyltransferase [Halomonas xianhensis]